MNSTAIFINLFALICLILAFFKDKKKTAKALLLSIKSFVRMLPMIFIILIVIGILLGFVPEETISKIIGENSNFIGIILIGLTGAIMHIPSLISFPLASSLIEKGASVTSVAVFITTLTMIGFVTLPLEIREMGKKFAFLRNGISFIIAVIIGLLMGLFYYMI